MLPSDTSIVTQLLGCIMNRLANNEFAPGNVKLFWVFVLFDARVIAISGNLFMYVMSDDLCFNLNGIECMMKLWTKGAWVIMGL